MSLREAIKQASLYTVKYKNITVNEMKKCPIVLLSSDFRLILFVGCLFTLYLDLELNFRLLRDFQPPE